MNNIILYGRIVNNGFELRCKPGSAHKYIQFGLAVPDAVSPAEISMKLSHCDIFVCTAFDSVAENIIAEFKPPCWVNIEGKLKTRQHRTSDGGIDKSYTIIVNKAYRA